MSGLMSGYESGDTSCMVVIPDYSKKSQIDPSNLNDKKNRTIPQRRRRRSAGPTPYHQKSRTTTAIENHHEDGFAVTAIRKDFKKELNGKNSNFKPKMTQSRKEDIIENYGNAHGREYHHQQQHQQQHQQKHQQKQLQQKNPKQRNKTRPQRRHSIAHNHLPQTQLNKKKEVRRRPPKEFFNSTRETMPSYPEQNMKPPTPEIQVRNGENRSNSPPAVIQNNYSRADGADDRPRRPSSKHESKLVELPFPEITITKLDKNTHGVDDRDNPTDAPRRRSNPTPQRRRSNHDDPHRRNSDPQARRRHTMNHYKPDEQPYHHNAASRDKSRTKDRKLFSTQDRFLNDVKNEQKEITNPPDKFLQERKQQHEPTMMNNERDLEIPKSNTEPPAQKRFSLNTKMTKIIPQALRRHTLDQFKRPEINKEEPVMTKEDLRIQSLALFDGSDDAFLCNAPPRRSHPHEHQDEEESRPILYRAPAPSATSHESSNQQTRLSLNSTNSGGEIPSSNELSQQVLLPPRKLVVQQSPIMLASAEMEKLNNQLVYYLNKKSLSLSDQNGTGPSVESILLSGEALPTRKSFPENLLTMVRMLPRNDQCCDCGDYCFDGDGDGDDDGSERKTIGSKNFYSSSSEKDKKKNEPMWASTTYGILLCNRCAFRHINNLANENQKNKKNHTCIDVVKSLQDGDWTFVEVIAMLEGGNHTMIQHFLNERAQPHAAATTTTETQQSNQTQTQEISRVPNRRGSLLGSTPIVAKLDGEGTQDDSANKDAAYENAFQLRYSSKAASSYRKQLSQRVLNVVYKHTVNATSIGTGFGVVEQGPPGGIPDISMMAM